MTRGRLVRVLLLLALVLVVSLALALLLGEVGLDPQALLAGDRTERDIFLARAQRVALAAIVGAALGVAGAALQALVENPLADPFVLGLSGGAAIGATLAIALGLGSLGLFGGSLVGICAFAGCAAATVLVFSLGRVQGRLVPERLLLVGVVFNAFASAIILAIQSLVTPDLLRSLLDWLLGSIGHAPLHVLVTGGAMTLAGTLALTALAPSLNVLSLGELDAHGLGLDVPRTRRLVFAASALLVAAAVSLAGVIGFVGLIVPHLVRLAFGSDHRLVVPGSALAGAAFLALADLGARLFFRVASTLPPAGMVTALIGAPLFLWLLVHRSQRRDL